MNCHIILRLRNAAITALGLALLLSGERVAIRKLLLNWQEFSLWRWASMWSLIPLIFPNMAISSLKVVNALIPIDKERTGHNKNRKANHPEQRFFLRSKLERRQLRQ